MHEIEAEFSVVTPLFMSGANKKEAELRMSSIKGVIRFWWRALNYAKYATQANGSFIKALKEEEDKIFGSTQSQAAIRFQLTHMATNTGTTVSFRNRHGLIYLGYGVVDRNSRLERPCYESAQFTINLISKNEINEQVVDAIKLFGLIGGLGSRSRKGFGSVNLQRIEIKSGATKQCLYTQKNNLDYAQNLTQLLSKYKISDVHSLPQYTAVSHNTHIEILLNNNDPKNLLNDYGMKMQRYRSWGFRNNGKHCLPDKTQAEQNFKKDHHWFKQTEWRNNNRNFHPQRAIFGLPHNYFSNQNGNASVQPNEKYERRASALFFHVHQCQADDFLGIGILLPAEFLPKNIRLDTSGTPVDVETHNYKVILDFFTGKEGYRTQKTDKPYFPNRDVIWPPEVPS